MRPTCHPATTPDRAPQSRSYASNCEYPPFPLVRSGFLRAPRRPHAPPPERLPRSEFCPRLSPNVVALRANLQPNEFPLAAFFPMPHRKLKSRRTVHTQFRPVPPQSISGPGFYFRSTASRFSFLCHTKTSWSARCGRKENKLCRPSRSDCSHLTFRAAPFPLSTFSNPPGTRESSARRDSVSTLPATSCWAHTQIARHPAK